MRCTICRRQQESDLEANREGHARREILDFNHRSWILDHHIHNLITKIVKPDDSRFDQLFKRKSEASEASDSNRGQPQKRNSHDKQQQPREGTCIHAQSEGCEQSYRINLCELQRLRLRQLQHQLVQHTVDLRYDGVEPSGWAEDVRQYVQALQDYDYMGKYISQARDPFIVTGERFIDRQMLQAAMRNKEDEADPLTRARSFLKWEDSDIHPEPIGGTRDENFRRAWIKGFQQRLEVAAIGGMFLIGPMWLMVLHRTLYTALVSTTVFVTIFGLVMALFLDGLRDVLSSTAAYSAVLVVFVGLTVPNTGP